MAQVNFDIGRNGRKAYYGPDGNSMKLASKRGELINHFQQFYYSPK
jgi:hypothetical protein